MTESREEPMDSSARAFAMVWALAMLFHFNDYIRVASPSAFAWLLGATALFVTRGHPFAWLALALGQLCDLWFVMPLSAASDFFTGSVHVLVVITFVAVALKKRSLSVSRAELFSAAHGTLAGAFLLLFFFAVFHKLNRDFFDPEVSWGPAFYDYFAGLFGVPPLPFVRDTAPYVTALLEIFPVVALPFVRARAAAVFAIWGLFFLVATQGIIQFSALTYAGTVLFLNPRVFAAAEARFALLREGETRWGMHPALLVVWIALALCAALGLPHIVWVLVWVIVFVTMAVAALRLSKAAGVTLCRERLSRPPPYAWPLLLLIVVNEASPYLGAKDWPTYRMYSNLEVDSCGSNHLIVPGRAPDLERELVTTEETWRIAAGYFQHGREYWEKVSEWLFSGTDVYERSSWDPVTFGEMMAALARKNGMAPDDVDVFYLRRGEPVRETLASLLERERRHPLHRFFARRPEPDVPCAQRGDAYPPRF